MTHLNPLEGEPRAPRPGKARHFPQVSPTECIRSLALTESERLAQKRGSAKPKRTD